MMEAVMKPQRRRESCAASLITIITLLFVLIVSAPAPYTHAATLTGLNATSTSKIRAATIYARAFGYRGGFPTYDAFDYLDGRGPVWGSILLKLTAADYQEIPYTELDNSSPEALVISTKDWAQAHGYQGAFPTFEGRFIDAWTFVRGAVLFKPGTADFQDIPATELDTSSSEALIRTVNRYAVAHGYRGGFPTFQTATYSNGPVWGAFLIKQTAADWRDVPATSLEIPVTVVNERYSAWTIGGGYVYWAYCPSPPIRVTQDMDISDVVNAATGFYLRRMHLPTGSVQTLIDNLMYYDFPCSDYGLKADDTNLYSWGSLGLTKRLIDALDQPVQLYSGSLPNNDIWIVGEDAVYWASKTQIFRAAKTGAGGIALVNAVANDLAVDSQYVYWTNNTGVWRALLTCVAASCIPQQLSTEPSYGLAVERGERALYVNVNQKSIRRLTCSTNSCSASTIYSTTDSIETLSSGAKSLFWTEAYDPGCAPGPCFRNYRVRRMSTTVGGPVTLVDETSSIPGVLTDSLGVYIDRPRYRDYTITLFPVFNINRTFLSTIQR